MTITAGTANCPILRGLGIVCNRTHSYHHTALSEISNRIVGGNITKHYFSLFVGFTDFVVLSTGWSGAKTKYRVPTVRGQ